MPRSRSRDCRTPSPYTRRQEEHRRSRSRSPHRRRRSSTRSPTRDQYRRSPSPPSPPPSYQKSRKRGSESPPSRNRDERMEEPRSRKQIPKGFKWKDKPATSSRDDYEDEGRSRRTRDHAGLERGYRERSRDRHDRYERDREREKDRERDRDRDADRPGRRSPPPTTAPPVPAAEEPDEDAFIRAKFGDVKPKSKPSTTTNNNTNQIKPSSNGGISIEDKFGPGASSYASNTTSNGIQTTNNYNNDEDEGHKSKKKKTKKDGSTQRIAPTSEPMIIVNVNDRLGTKAAIPCLASDPVRLFKAQVAARIGREPHEIMLKRQGERPFKDALTLEDYGVSSGVQLDLEVDTGD